jgi:hypothetical protein
MRNQFSKIYGFADKFRNELTRKGIYEFFPYNQEVARKFTIFCRDGHKFQGVCAEFFHIAAGGNSGQVNISMLGDILGQLPAGASLGRLGHLGQGVRTGKFRRFDYGAEKNLQVYGVATPPRYELEKITVPLFFHYAEVDPLDDIKVSFESCSLKINKLDS